MPRLILASRSPRRQALLAELVADFEVEAAAVEEKLESAEGPFALARENACLKAAALAEKYPDARLIGSDTVVALGHRSLGKPADREQARRMLGELSGQTHSVHTGVALSHQAQGFKEAFVVTSEVRFFRITEEEMDAYLDAMDPTGFAGAYPIQHLMGGMVAGFNGSYTNIVGLPLERLRTAMREARWME